MTKRTLKLIGDLNELYNILWNNWTKTKSGTKEFEDLSQKLKLIRVIVKNIEEQSRGFLKTKVDYVAGGECVLLHYSSSYEDLLNKVNVIMLGI